MELLYFTILCVKHPTPESIMNYDAANACLEQSVRPSTTDLTRKFSHQTLLWPYCVILTASHMWRKLQSSAAATFADHIEHYFLPSGSHAWECNKRAEKILMRACMYKDAESKMHAIFSAVQASAVDAKDSKRMSGWSLLVRWHWQKNTERSTFRYSADAHYDDNILLVIFFSWVEV